jgi:hypothetical protein
VKRIYGIEYHLDTTEVIKLDTLKYLNTKEATIKVKRSDANKLDW